MKKIKYKLKKEKNLKNFKIYIIGFIKTPIYYKSIYSIKTFPLLYIIYLIKCIMQNIILIV